MKNLSLFITILFLSTLLSTQPADAKSTFVTIGTGGITGVYYPTGAAIAKMVNRKKKEYGIRAIVELTGGSVFNINALMTDDLDFGLVQSDRQFQALNGIAEWKDKGPQTELRAVFSLHPEAVTLIAASDSGIKNISDLRGKRVNIGNLGSGHRKNAIDALSAAGIDYQKDIQAKSFKASESAGLLQDNQIDAFFYTVGHPSVSIKEVTSGSRKVIIADITGIDGLLESSPYYIPTTISIDLYPGVANKQDVTTFGVKATLCTSSRVAENVVYAVTKEVFENLEAFKHEHPAFHNLTKKSMLTELSAPLHNGAIKFFNEAGLLQ